MLKVEVTEEQRNFCLNFLKEKSIANRGKFDGDEHKQLFGLQAQIIVSDLLKLPRPKNLGFDGGVDFKINNFKVDVKCEIRTVDFKPNFVHNVAEYQIKYPVDFYVFVSYNKETGVFFICGFISKEQFLKDAKFFPAGTVRFRSDGSSLTLVAGDYELEHKFLTKIESLMRWTK